MAALPLAKQETINPSVPVLIYSDIPENVQSFKRKKRERERERERERKKIKEREKESER